MRSIELAKRIGAVCEGSDVELIQVASFGSAMEQSLVFVEHARFLDSALNCAAGAVIVAADAAVGERRGKVLLRTKNPRLAFALAAEELRRCAVCEGGVDASAIVDPSAEVATTACVDELAVVGAGAKIGARSHVGPGCVIGPGVVMGEDCNLVARVTVYPGTTMGDRVIVQAGAVLGGDGFGFVPDPATGRFHKFPQIGRLEIGNDVEIGANTTIDRGALDATVIADGVKLDNLVQVGHNVRIGRNVVVASQTGISGSSVLEDGVIVGGQVGIADHVTIEQGVILGAQSGVPSKKVVRGKGVVFWGTPARPIGEYLKELATLARITRKRK
ncbi:MAG TPA: UDP-3-O-(3-hydroxymyristoyl)glucosamine N-acyltransferase [Candidatus Saccharimonadales bacterium]|nr:UDP-3-O-(3-hydroxymyristoyl)glucosamine N-acyltransferase [Candidatus Saccharimonadales bacterium]